MNPYRLIAIAFATIVAACGPEVQPPPDEHCPATHPEARVCMGDVHCDAPAPVCVPARGPQHDGGCAVDGMPCEEPTAENATAWCCAEVEHVRAGEHCYEVAVNTCASGAVEWECWDPAQIDGRAVADPYSGCVEHAPSVTGTARYCCP